MPPDRMIIGNFFFFFFFFFFLGICLSVYPVLRLALTFELSKIYFIFGVHTPLMEPNEGQ